jgi:hypothetical protein
MAKKVRAAKNSRKAARGAKLKPPVRSTRSKPAARQSAKGRSLSSAERKTSKPSRRTARQNARRSADFRKAVDGYVATLNDWRKNCVAQLRKIMRGVEFADPRKVLKQTGKKMRHIKFRRLKEAGLREFHALVRLASNLNELERGPGRRARSIAKRK